MENCARTTLTPEFHGLTFARKARRYPSSCDGHGSDVASEKGTPFGRVIFYLLQLSIRATVRVRYARLWVAEMSLSTCDGAYLLRWFCAHVSHKFKTFLGFAHWKALAGPFSVTEHDRVVLEVWQHWRQSC